MSSSDSKKTRLNSPLPETEVTRLELPGRTFEIEQLAGLTELTIMGIRTGSDAPLWGAVWPSGRALASAIYGLELEGLSVLDLGAGTGIASVAAAARGAKVIAADIKPSALELVKRNAERNEVEVETLELDWESPPKGLGPFDRVFAADVLYGDGMLRGVMRFLKTHLAPDGGALIADPNRVMPGGIQGAARLSGFVAQAHTLNPTGSVTGGVTLYELVRSRR